MSDNSLSKFLNKLNNLEIDTINSVKRTVEKNIREVVQADAKSLCPVDDGDLRESIKVKTKIEDNSITGIVYTNNEYAAYVEFGTGKVGENTPVGDKYPGPLSYKQDKWLVNIPDVGPRWIDGQPAQPYLYPAIKNNKEKILENIKSDVKKAMKEAIKK